jgi:formate dehydrogenase maturation protein FdhE
MLKKSSIAPSSPILLDVKLREDEFNRKSLNFLLFGAL